MKKYVDYPNTRTAIIASMLTVFLGTVVFIGIPDFFETLNTLHNPAQPLEYQQ